MQYKTMIEVHTEAANQYEAADIAGEFLRGDITTGANVKVHTVSLAKARMTKLALIVCAVTFVSGACVLGNQVYLQIASAKKTPVTSYAIQPPLRTNLSEAQGKEFRNIWQKTQQDRIDSATR